MSIQVACQKLKNLNIRQRQDATVYQMEDVLGFLSEVGYNISNYQSSFSVTPNAEHPFRKAVEVVDKAQNVEVTPGELYSVSNMLGCYDSADWVRSSFM